MTDDRQRQQERPQEAQVSIGRWSATAAAAPDTYQPPRRSVCHLAATLTRPVEALAPGHMARCQHFVLPRHLVQSSFFGPPSLKPEGWGKTGGLMHTSASSIAKCVIVVRNTRTS